MAIHHAALARTPAFVTPSALQNRPTQTPLTPARPGLSQASPVMMQGMPNRFGTGLDMGTNRQANPVSRLGTSNWVGQGTRGAASLRAHNDNQAMQFRLDEQPPIDGNDPEGIAPQKEAFEVGYQALSGTSMATPHVAAVVADILSINPNLKTDEVRCILINSAVAGRMDHLQALIKAEESLTEPVNCPPKPLPQPKQDNAFIPERKLTPLTQSFDSPSQAKIAANGYAASHNVVASVRDNKMAVIPKQVMIRVGDDLAKQDFNKISDYLNEGLEDCQGANCRPWLRVTGQISPTVFVATVEREAEAGDTGGEFTTTAGELQATAMKMVCDTLPHYPGVKAIEADVIFPANSEITQAGDMISAQDDSKSPGDPLRPKQWGLNSPDEFGIGSDAAKAFRKLNGYPTPREAGIHIGVGDTGNGAHPDMEGVFLPGRRFDRSNYPPTDSTDRTLSVSHGQHVAGTAGAVTNNNIGIEGVTDAKILPAKVLSDQGSGSLVDIILGIRWMAGLDIDGRTRASSPARVINLSLGYEDACSQFLQDTINEANEKGVVIVVAAGNSNIDAGRDCPSNCRNVITVGAHDPKGERAEFSNYGPIVDIYAPGVNILAPTHRKVQARAPEENPKGPGAPQPPRRPQPPATPPQDGQDVDQTDEPKKKPWWLKLG